MCSSKVNPQHKYTRQKFTENYRIISDTTSTLRDALRVMSHFSVRLCIGLNDLLKVVFPDSEIAKGFELSKTKCSYLINFGVSSYFKIELVNCIKVSTSFVSLDDSLNQIKQNEQMYTQICFWNEPTMMVERRYLIQRPNLKTSLLIWMIHWQNYYWKTCCSCQPLEPEVFQLSDRGSQGLHMIDGAFCTEVEATTWNIERFLKAMWQILVDYI